MMTHIKTFLKSCILFITLLGSLRLYYNKQIGNKIDEYKGIPVYFNSIPFTTQGETQAKDGYKFGKKYENIEFIKRFYYKIYNKKINIKDIDYSKIKNSEIIGNLKFFNDKKDIKIGDIAICKTLFGNEYFGIVTKVDKNSIQIIRQNFFKMTRSDIENNDKDFIGILTM